MASILVWGEASPAGPPALSPPVSEERSCTFQARPCCPAVNVPIRESNEEKNQSDDRDFSEITKAYVRFKEIVSACVLVQSKRTWQPFSLNPRDSECEGVIWLFPTQAPFR